MSTKAELKKVKKKLKNLRAVAIALAVIFFVVGGTAGWFTIKYLTQNDCFDLVGSATLQLEIGEKYADEGVKIVAFGQDASTTINCETNLQKTADGQYYASAVGEYYIIYTSSHIKYSSVKKIQKIRRITYVEKGEDNV